jgi:hypothetical protein
MKPRLRRGWPPEPIRDVLGRSTSPRSSIALKMSITSIRFRDVRFKLTLPLGRAWRGVLDYLLGSRVQRGGRAPTECFGGLSDKDKAVVRGLAAGLACSIERGQDR